MTVALTISKTKDGSQVADALNGGGSGVDLGDSQNGEADPSQSALFLTHNGTSFIYNLAVYLSQFSGTYGGDYSASDDIAKVLAHGDAGYGLQFGWDWQASNKFTSPTSVKTGVGDNSTNKILVPASAMSRDVASTETAPTAPVAGKIGSPSQPTQYIANGTFGSGASWTPCANTSISGGKLHFSSYSSGDGVAIGMLIGQLPPSSPYSFSFDCVTTGGTPVVEVDFYNSSTTANTQLWSWYHPGDGTQTNSGTTPGSGVYDSIAISLADGGPKTMTFDNISMNFTGLDVPTLGKRAHFFTRYLVPPGENLPGKRQFDFTFFYNFLT